jgi:acetyltransferase-like isoleucine patch superfamily enzyme
MPDNVALGHGVLIEREESFDRFRSTRRPGLVLGDGVEVYTWTTFNVEEQGFVEVGAHTILVGAVFMCAERISIGAGAIVSYGVTIADSDFHPRDPALRKRDALANAPDGDQLLRPPLETRPVTIGDDVRIGIGAIILKGVTIGAAARIGPGSVVTTDVAAGAVVAGNPAQSQLSGFDQ